MRKAALVLAASLSLSAIAAQETTEGTVEAPTIKNPTKITKGGFIGLRKSFGEKLTAKASFAGESESASQSDFENSISLTAGYADINIEKVGFMGSLNLDKYESDEGEDGDLKAIRIDGNATYGVNENVYLFGGLNINDYTGSDTSDIDTGLGYQLGVGAVFSNNLGVNLKHYTTNNSADIDTGLGSVDVDLKMTITELGVSYHF